MVELKLRWDGQVFVWMDGEHMGNQLHEEDTPNVERQEVLFVFDMDRSNVAAASAHGLDLQEAIDELTRWLREDRGATSVEVFAC